MAMRDILDRQANSLEYVMHTHGLAARIDGGKLSPRLAHFHVVLPPGVRPAHLAQLAPELAETLGVVSCRLAPGEDGVYLEVPRPDPVPVRLLPLVQRVADVIPPITATLGLDTDGTPLLLRLDSPDVDPVIVSGNAEAGKSSLLRSMAISLALHNSPDRLRLLLIDATRDGNAFRGLESLPHLACPIANGPVDALVSLRWALRILARRTRAYTEEELFDEEEMGDEPLFELTGGQDEEPALVIMIDGAAELCAAGPRRTGAEATEALHEILAEGSRYGIHAVLAAERLDGLAGLGSPWKARIAGWVNSAEAARAATGMKGSGAQGLLGAGDFLVALNAEIIRFQAAAITPAEMGKAVEFMGNAAHNRSRKQVQVDTPPVAPVQPEGRSERPAGEPLQLRRTWSGE